MTSRSIASAAVEMQGISKRFGGVHALQEVDFTGYASEIHALLGENGAGKSTILKILRGVTAPDEGLIIVNGQPYERLSPSVARDIGIGMIFQEMSLVPSLTVAQNIFLNSEPKTNKGLIDDRAMRERSLAIFKDMGVEIDPTTQVGDLSTGQQQLTEIAKALSQNAQILVLDEPTSALPASEVEILFELLGRMRKENKAIIYVSHRMDEIFELADRATVLRNGKVIDCRAMSDYTLPSLITDIMGEETQDLSEYSTASAAREAMALEVKGLRSSHDGKGATFALHDGEVLGIAGLLGSGRSRLARMLFGLQSITAGDVFVHGQAVSSLSPMIAMSLGMALVPEDRRREGLILDHSVTANIELPILDRLGSLGFIGSHASRKIVRNIIDRMRIRISDPDDSVGTLSGGNQQKVVIGKWLAISPNILILDEPTAGIDIGTKGEVLSLVRQLAKDGKSIIFISSELTELMAVSDRIAVMARGEIVNTLDGRQLISDGDEAGTDVRAEQKLQILLQRGGHYA